MAGRTELKTFFETGDKPTAAEFATLIDSVYNLTDDSSPGLGDLLFLTNTQIAPTAPAFPTLTEVQTYVTSAAITNTIAYYNGTDVANLETATHIYIVDDGGDVVVVREPAAATATEWELWSDTQYTTGSRLTIAAGVRTKLPNNGGSSITAYGPSGINFYNGTTQKLTPEAQGDTYSLRTNYSAEPQAVNAYMTVEIDIGGSDPIIYSHTFPFPKGAGVVNTTSDTILLFSYPTFVANGGEIYVTCSRDTEFFDVSYLIARH